MAKEYDHIQKLGRKIQRIAWTHPESDSKDTVLPFLIKGDIHLSAGQIGSHVSLSYRRKRVLSHWMNDPSMEPTYIPGDWETEVETLLEECNA